MSEGCTTVGDPLDNNSFSEGNHDLISLLNFDYFCRHYIPL